MPQPKTLAKTRKTFSKNFLLFRILLTTLLLIELPDTTTADFIINYSPYIILLISFPYIASLKNIQLNQKQIVWLTIGILIHPLGIIHGFYSEFWFYDTAAHIYSSTIITSIIILFLTRNNFDHRKIGVYSFTALMILATFWEILERLTPTLTVYGLTDTVTDYIANITGWAIMSYKLNEEKPGLE